MGLEQDGANVNKEAIRSFIVQKSLYLHMHDLIYTTVMSHSQFHSTKEFILTHG
jgi:hypothetical protein